MTNRIKVLDCTLRDGGYINDWLFGNKTIHNIIDGLVEAKVDIIECGFIRGVDFNEDSTSFSSMEHLSRLIFPKSPNTLYAVMVEQHNYFDGLVDSYCPRYADIIRLTFRKHEWQNAKKTAIELINLGYKVCIQPVGTTNYSDEELLILIKDVNAINPFAFYLVDTLGTMYQHDLRRLFYLVDTNLKKNIMIGFHSHNNLQMSFANAQEMIRISAQRNISIDSSCFGMGRGVGNLNTELLLNYLNHTQNTNYSITPILNIIDRDLMNIFALQKWGYDLPYFLSGIIQCHPNYASYLLRKETLNIESIEKILNLLPREKRGEFDSKLIESLYINYQNNNMDDSEAYVYLREHIGDNPVLILGPGGSLNINKERILSFINNNKPVVISVNFILDEFKIDYVFVSNEKRASSIKTHDNELIITSNVSRIFENGIVFSYTSLLGEGDASDNAGAMLIRILKKIGVPKLYLAGFDGFSVESDKNYFNQANIKTIDYETADYKNKSISKQLKAALSGVDYKLITESKYEL